MKIDFGAAAAVAVLVGLLGTVGYGVTSWKPDKGPDEPTPAPLATDNPQWRHNVTTDRMTGASGGISCVRSDNVVDLGWPYEPLGADLCIRRSSAGRREAMLRLTSDAVIICHPYDCPIRVRFDDEAPLSLQGGEPEDGGSDMVFIDNAARIERGLAAAKRTRVEILFHDEGRKIFEFRTSHYPPP